MQICRCKYGPITSKLLDLSIPNSSLVDNAIADLFLVTPAVSIGKQTQMAAVHNNHRYEEKNVLILILILLLIVDHFFMTLQWAPLRLWTDGEQTSTTCTEHNQQVGCEVGCEVCVLAFETHWSCSNTKEEMFRRFYDGSVSCDADDDLICLSRIW